MLNVRPEATAEKRLRGGSRPGLVKSFAQQIGGGSLPVRMLTVMRSLNSEGRVTFDEDFSATLVTDWDFGSWHTNGQIRTEAGQGLVVAKRYRGAILQNGSGEPAEKLSTNAPYTIECWFDPSAITSSQNAVYQFGGFSLLARLDDATPSILSCVRALVRFGVTEFAVQAKLRMVVDNVVYEDADIFPISTGSLEPGVLSLTIDGELASASWIPDSGSGGSIARVSTDVSTASTGDRVAIDVDLTLPDTGTLYMDDFRLHYITTDGGVPPEAVVASGNGELWRETTEGAMVQLTGAGLNGLTLASDRPLQAVDRLGKLYIADTSDTRLTKTDNTGVIVNGVLDATGIDNWDTYGILTEDDVVEITNVVGGTGVFASNVDGVFSVAAVNATSGLSLDVLNGSPLGASDDCTTCDFRIVRGAKVYDSDADTLTHWKATAGLVPVGCPIIDIFRDRLVLGGIKELPGIWFMSKFGDPDNFDFSRPDTERTRAIASNTTTSDAGGLSIPMSAIAAITEDYLVISAASEMYLLRGDPTLGGILANVSSQIGIGSRTAHCRTPDGSLIFLSRDGLYRFHPANPFPENISRDRLPSDLINIVQNTDRTVTLEYDVLFQGVHIYVTFNPVSAGAVQHYWFDWETQSFWVVRLGSRLQEPFAVSYDAKKNRVMLGGRDGYIRHYDSAATDDDGTTIDSHVLYGPFSLGGNTGEGSVSDLYMTLDDASGNVTAEVFVGDDPESAFKSTAKTSHTVSAGYSKRLPVRARGSSAFVKISSSSGSQWTIDSLSLVTQRHGRHRG